VRALALGCWLAAAATTAAAQAPAVPQDEPREGRPGKDVIWLATPDVLVEKMLDLAAVSPRDRLLDLGSGDGRLVIAAARRGARATGLEYDAELVALSQRRAAAAGVVDRVTFAQADIFAVDLPPAEVITLFLRGDLNLRLRPRLLALPPGTRVVSNTFDMGNWRPDQTARVAGCDTWCFAHLWIVPARVEGNWTLGDALLTLEQSFQKLTGTLSRATTGQRAVTGHVEGDRVTIETTGGRYTGRLVEGRLEGSTDTGVAWSAQRMP
jgi:SAM-dependent methyltransferase